MWKVHTADCNRDKLIDFTGIAAISHPCKFLCCHLASVNLLGLRVSHIFWPVLSVIPDLTFKI